MPNRAAFPRTVRMLDKPAFDAVLRQPDGRSRRSGVQVLWRANRLDHPRLGLIIPKRQLRLAVQRNALKRRIRETFRTQMKALPAADCVVRLVNGRELLNQAPSRSDLTGEIQQLFGKMTRAAGSTSRTSSPAADRSIASTSADARSGEKL